MKRRRGLWVALGRFVAGLVLGIMGMGRMGASLIPGHWRPGSAAFGLVEVAVGSVLALGVLVARQRSAGD